MSSLCRRDLARDLAHDRACDLARDLALDLARDAHDLRGRDHTLARVDVGHVCYHHCYVRRRLVLAGCVFDSTSSG